MLCSMCCTRHQCSESVLCGQAIGHWQTAWPDYSRIKWLFNRCAHPFRVHSTLVLVSTVFFCYHICSVNFTTPGSLSYECANLSKSLEWMSTNCRELTNLFICHNKLVNYRQLALRGAKFTKSSKTPYTIIHLSVTVYWVTELLCIMKPRESLTRKWRHELHLPLIIFTTNLNFLSLITSSGRMINRRNEMCKAMSYWDSGDLFAIYHNHVRTWSVSDN